MNKLGIRLKYFRERARMSQFDLELEIQASGGTVSRIEQGKVNPTKETVFKIAQALNLNNNESNYLFGITSEPVTEIEVDRAINEFFASHSRKSFGYIIDDDWRVWMVTEQMLKILGLSENQLKNIIGKVIIELLLIPKYGIFEKLDQSEFKSLIERNLSHYYISNIYKVDNIIFRSTENLIKQNKVANQIWSDIKFSNGIDYNLSSNSKVYFRFFNYKIPFIYNYERLLNNDKFQFVEFTPENQFLNILSKFI